jgi:subtilisin family serine protease
VTPVSARFNKEGLMLGWIRGSSGASRSRRYAVAAAAAALMGLTFTAAAQASTRDRLAPVRTAPRGGIAGHYIVVLKGALPLRPTKRSERAARAEARRVASSVNARPLFVYDGDLKGFAAKLTRAQLRELRHSPQVKYVEQDERVRELDTQTGATWGLTRIDQRSLDLNGIYTYSPTAGRGVTAYIIDTGIQTNNVDFGSRASNGYDAIGGTGSGSDCNGHGTHVAGTVAGKKYGVAKLTTLIGVRVLGCQGQGTTAGVIQGLNWVTEHHVADKSVANMSLGGSASTVMDDALNRLVDSGVFVSAAAGNDNRNACNTSPARAPTAFTVAASDTNDRKASFSNFGPCVDAYAPGVGITSDWIGSPTATSTINGTSMAAPHVAGVAALYLSERSSTPAGTSKWIVDHATTGVISGSPTDTANLLLYKDGL